MPRAVLDLELPDGSRVHIRPIRPSDKAALARGLSQLSPHSRYLRFHTPVVELSEAQLAYLTEVDFVDHVAWVALDPYAREDPGMAVARYVRLPDAPRVAEAAVTVADSYQARGVGSLLLGVLARSARERGIDTFRCFVLAENTGMLRIFERLGTTVVTPESDLCSGPTVLRVDLTLPYAVEGIDDAALRRVLRQAASEELPALPVLTRAALRELRPVLRGTATGKRPDGEQRAHPGSPEAGQPPAAGDSARLAWPERRARRWRGQRAECGKGEGDAKDAARSAERHRRGEEGGGKHEDGEDEAPAAAGGEPGERCSEPGRGGGEPG